MAKNKSKRPNTSDIHYRPPFSVSEDGKFVLDSLGYVVCQFKDTEYIGTISAAKAIADAFSQPTAAFYTPKEAVAEVVSNEETSVVEPHTGSYNICEWCGKKYKENPGEITSVCSVKCFFDLMKSINKKSKGKKGKEVNGIRRRNSMVGFA